MTEKYISFRKAGEMLGVSKDTVRAYVYKGILIADDERGKRKVLLSSVYNHLKDIDKQAERKVGERLKLINLKLDLVDLTEGVVGSFLFYYDDEVKKICELPPQKRGAELRKLANRIKEDYKTGRIAV